MKFPTYLLSLITLVFSFSVSAETLKGQYELKSSSIGYTVTYLIKKADGGSVASKGKGECSDSCHFLVAVPVKSFESKDSNRDLNMLKVLKADKYPMVIAKINSANELVSNYKTDIELEFVGEKYTYKGVTFTTKGNTSDFTAEAVVNVSLKNHKIEKPSLLGVEIEDNLPVVIKAQWVQRKN